VFDSLKVCGSHTPLRSHFWTNPIDSRTQLIDVEWLMDHRGHSQSFEGFTNIFQQVRRDYDDFTVDAAFPNRFNQIDSGAARHFLIDNDDIVGVGGDIEPGQSRATIVGAGHLVAWRSENES